MDSRGNIAGLGFVVVKHRVVRGINYLPQVPATCHAIVVGTSLGTALNSCEVVGGSLVAAEGAQFTKLIARAIRHCHDPVIPVIRPIIGVSAQALSRARPLNFGKELWIRTPFVILIDK